MEQAFSVVLLICVAVVAAIVIIVIFERKRRNRKVDFVKIGSRQYFKWLRFRAHLAKEDLSFWAKMAEAERKEKEKKESIK